MAAKRVIYQFKIELLGTSPPIRRRIQVPEKYSFWDLHVAIQDAMGWLDCHLHAFRFGRSRFPSWAIGIPTDDDFGGPNVLAGWDIAIQERFDVGTSCTYEYDFGDGWSHELTLESIILAEKGQRYPICLDGELSCPPEDCGGIPGFYHLLEVLADPNNEEYEDMNRWTGGNYNPNDFDPSTVKFDNPRKRWEYAFEDGT